MDSSYVMRDSMEKKLIIIAVVIAAIVVVGGISAALLLGKESKVSGTVKYVTLAPKDMKAALASGSIDAYIAWEPYVSDSVVGNVGDVLEWSSEIMPNHPCCVVAVSPDFLSGTNGVSLTERFLKAHIDANNWMLDALAHPTKANYTALVDMAVQFTSRNATVVKAAFEHVKYGYEMNQNFRDSLKQFTDMYIETNMTSASKLQDRGYSSSTDFISKYVNGTMLDAARTITPSSTILNPSNPIRLGYLLGDLHQMAQVVAQNTTAFGGTSMFQKYGLLVKNATGAPFASGGTEMSLGFAGNAVDIGYLGAPPAIINHLNSGVKALIVAQANSEGSGLVVKANSGIHNLGNLVNKTVATPGETSIQFLLLKIALDREGLDLKIKT
jgi:NitT/TauT family transport system substrate-binding protein